MAIPSGDPFGLGSEWQGPRYLQSFGFQWPTFAQGGGQFSGAFGGSEGFSFPSWLGGSQIMNPRGPQNYNLPLLRPANGQSRFLPQPGATGKPPTGAAPSAAGVATPASNNVVRFDKELRAVAAESGVPYEVLAALMSIENGSGDPNVVRSDSGAAGLMQVVGGPLEPTENIRAAAKLLRTKQQAFQLDPNDWDNTAAAYFGAYPNLNATDATGTNGNTYVQKFRAAKTQYATANTTATTSAPPPAGTGYAFSQFAPGLSSAEQYAACGPAVAAAFASLVTGYNVDVSDSFRRAAHAGWWANGEMQGPENEAKLIDHLTGRYQSVQVHYDRNWQGAAASLQAGKPVVVDTVGHYYLIDRMENGMFHHANFRDLKGGKEWMTAQEFDSQPQSQGPVRSLLY